MNLHGGGDGYYAPIAVGPQLSTELRPLYFGMQFADQFCGADLYSTELDTPSNATAYFGTRGRETLLAIINKSQEPVVVELPKKLADKKPKDELRLSSPSLDATSGISLVSATATRKKSATLAPYAALLLKWE